MLSVELQLLTILRALAEIAGMFLLAQGALFLLVGGRHQDNFVYQLFRIITRPVIGATRWLMPKLLGERSIPFVAFFLLFWLWIVLAYARQAICHVHGLACG